jgi:hypothetical protein
MTVTSTRALLAVLLIAALAALVGGTAHADISQTPVATACPAGYEHLSVASLEAAGPYIVPRRVDTAGNNNGSVCGLALPDSVRDVHCKLGGLVACQLAQLGLPLYQFTDDDNPASQNAQVDD